MQRKFYRLLTELSSRKFISKAAGWLAQSEISRFFIPHFAKTYRIRAEDAEKPLHEYKTLNEFFTRRLRAGLRPIDEQTDTLVSPVDAVITGMGTIASGQLMNIKGQDYALDQLLLRSPRAVNYRHGFYYVLYLSPTDYHRIHSPASGTIIETEHIHGRVYPVNDFGLTHMKHVLSRNERLITYMNHTHGEIAIVKVGAFNVSSIHYTNPSMKVLTKGDELAYFQFGSTVVLLMEDGTYTPSSEVEIGGHVQMGQVLGTIHTKKLHGIINQD